MPVNATTIRFQPTLPCAGKGGIIQASGEALELDAALVLVHISRCKCRCRYMASGSL